MSVARIATREVLIWGKTYPELSWRHRETVCTGGCDVQGRPVRLYPVPLRYLPNGKQYSLWDLIRVPMEPSARDSRPESRRIVSRKIAKVRHIPTGRQRSWTARREWIFRDKSWHYECVRDLEAAERKTKTSLGFVKVGSVERVWLADRSGEERRRHERKLADLTSQGDLFGYDQKDLEFFPFKVMVRWRCERLTGKMACPSHKNVILDWGLGELGRREGPQAALTKMEDVANLNECDLHFFMGNFKAHPHRFGVVGLWYPKHKNRQQRDLFSPP